MSRAKVVHVVVAGEIGGAERMLVDLASRPARSNADHVVAIMTPSDALARFFVDAGLRVKDRGRVAEHAAAYLWRSLGPRDAAWLEAVLRDERATVAHLHTFASHVVGSRAARAAGVPVVRTEHSTRVYTDPSCWPFSRWSLKRAQAVVAISHHVRDAALQKATFLRGVSVIPNGVDTTRFRPGAPPPPRTEGPFRLSLVARLEPRKGVDLAIDAIARTRDVTLDIVGDGQDAARLREQARPLGDRVRFHGRLDDVRDVHAASDAVLCSSREEGLGIAVLEGMAMGKPIVSFPVGGVPEIVEDGVHGWLADGPTAGALARAIDRARRDARSWDSYGAAARDRVVAKFSIDRMCAAYGQVYETVGRTLDV